MQYHLAVDIGASSGRHVVGWLEGGHLQTKEIYRFQNGMVKKNGTLIWDIDALFAHVVTGMRGCREQGIVPLSMGIDMWGVDFALIDGDGRRLGDVVAYRDGRTAFMADAVERVLSFSELYRHTGIQKQSFNTVYQLAALQQNTPNLLAQAQHLLLLPDYLHYCLTGVMAQEYTNATTTSLVSARNGDWDYELIQTLNLPRHLFKTLSMPGTHVGTLLPSVQSKVGFDCAVILPATHDTGSAVVALPSESENPLYISSGTWSLMGIECSTPNCSADSQALNFTNEGGYNRRYRYLKNIMGLWMIQSVRHELADQVSFATLCGMATAARITSIVDCNDPRFLAPASMTAELRMACLESGQAVPETPGELAAVIYNSLAACYARTVTELERLTGRTYDTIHVVGGGANAAYLNMLTAKATGRRVLAGPTEATAIGNLLVQMIATGQLRDLTSARKCVCESFDILTY